MKTGLTTLLILNCLLSLTFAVSDDNICAESCQYCCRNKQCKSQSECKGNYQPFIILGCIAGGLIGLFIARRVYVHYRNKGMIARGEDPKAKKGTRSRWRSRKGSKSPAKEKKRKESSDRKKKEKVKERPSSSSKSSKPSKPRSLKDADAGNKSKGDIYLQIDNESVLSAEDVKSATNKNAPLSSRNELKPTSKNEILVKSDTNLEDKDRLNPYKQNRIPDMPAKKDSKENKNKDDKRSTSKGKTTSSSTNRDNKKPASSMKDSKMAGSMRESKAGGNASAKDRGRSRDAGKGGERSTSQKKPTSSGPNNRDKSRGQSAGRKDRV